jgi:1,4-dihydroxy-2-naphthoyl-CoA hydrolase
MSIWHQKIDLEKLNKLMCTGNMLEHLDVTFTEIGDDYLTARMPVDWRTHQPAGILHGGASVVLAETVGSVAANLCVDMRHYACVGQEVNANHLRSKPSGWVSGTARPVHIGQRSQVWEIRIVDEQERLICVSRLTMAVVKNNKTA